MFLLLGSCKHEVPIPTNNELNDNSLRPLSSLVQDGKAPEIAQINLISLAYSRALTELLQGDEFRSSILSQLERSPASQKLPFQYLVDNLQGFGDSLNAQLSKQLAKPCFVSLSRLGLNSAELHKCLTDFLRYEGYSYQPEIHRVSDFIGKSRSESVIIALGEDVTPDDKIPAWFLSDEDFFLLSEDEAITSLTPIIIVGLGDFEPEIESDNDGIVDVTSDGRFNNVAFISCKTLKVNVNYDNTDKQEINVVGVRYTPNLIVSQTVPIPLDRKHIQDVPDNFIGNIFSFVPPKLFTSLLEDNYNDGTNIFFATFERDWFSSKKTISNPCWGFGNNMNVQANMKYSHEWYTRTCGEYDVLFPNFVWSSFNDAVPVEYTTTNSKATFKFVLKD